MGTKSERKRPLKRSELRYVLFHEDQYKDAPDKLKMGANLHVGRWIPSKDAVIVACSGEAYLDKNGGFDAYPFFSWFKESGAPICGKCERVMLEDIEMNGLED